MCVNIKIIYVSKWPQFKTFESMKNLMAADQIKSYGWAVI